ncbi:transporter substrate-binding domain-containing protein [Candidatus Nomurabacteria bacterium]|nr:transporter substrate-binding domain-containing protein [Candidatus Nomurabacteria bacterium]
MSIMVSYRLSFIFFVSLFLLHATAQAVILAPEQQHWLDSKNNTIIVRPEKSYPPFSFVSSTPSIRPKGLAVDYLDLVARKLGAQPTYLEAKSRSSILEDLKSGKEGIALAISEKGELGDILYFTEPFIKIPAVIVTRKDYKKSSIDLTLADFNAKQVAITDGYAVSDYIKNNYQRIIIEPVTDDEVGLQKLLLGEVDAAVMDLASLSYYTSRDVLSYVTIAGQTGFEYELSFAVPRTMPDLQIILNAGLKEITPSERSIIKDRWITFPEKENLSALDKKFVLTGGPLWIGLSILGGIIIIILLTIMIVHSRKHHYLYADSVLKKKHKEDKINNLTKELENLENASSVLNENMEEIKTLEKTIHEKIENLKD